MESDALMFSPIVPWFAAVPAPGALNLWPVDRKRGMELYAEAVAVARQLGNRRGIVELPRGMAYVAFRQMLDRESARRSREMIQVIQDEGVSDKAGHWVNLAELLAAEGRFGIPALLGGVARVGGLMRAKCGTDIFAYAASRP